MDRIFNGVAQSQPDDVVASEDTSRDAYLQRIKSMMDDTVDYEDSILSPAREEATEYYQGKRPALGENVNKSTIVSTDVRDTIMSIMPSLMRIFASSENIVDFVPNSEQDVEMAAQATDYVNYVFWEDNDGFLVLHSVFKDALTLKLGIVKWWTDIEREMSYKTFHSLTQEQVQYLLSEVPEVEVVDQQVSPDGLVHSLTLRYAVVKPLTKVDAVPPDEFRVDRYARTLRGSRIVGHERVVSVSELVERGYNVDELRDNVTSTTPNATTERYLRNEGLDSGTRMADGVLFGEWFVRIDGDGDGVDELRCIKTIGDNRIVVEDYPTSNIKFAVFSPDPRPHTIVGDSITDLVEDIQRIKTNMLRGALDSLAESTNPRTVINELIVNVDDALNDEVGAVIRTRGDPNNSVAFTKTPFVGTEVVEMAGYLDAVKQSRTGISEASKGVDPRALQSTNLMGIEAIVSGAQERIELIARILCETGMKDMLRGLLREIVDNPSPERTIKLRGKWVAVNPSLYDATMRVQVNPSLGKGSDMTRLQVLTQVKTDQMTVIEKFGIDNPVVGPVELLNTISDMLALTNIKNVSRYFRPVTQETLDAIKGQPKEPEPAQILAQAELEKTKAKIVETTAKLDHEDKKLRMDDDFRRDKLNVDSALKAAEIAAGQVGEQDTLEAMNQPGDDNEQID